MLSRHWLRLHYVRGQSIQSVTRRGEARVESLLLTCFLLKQKFSKNEIFSAWIEKNRCSRVQTISQFYTLPIYTDEYYFIVYLCAVNPWICSNYSSTSRLSSFDIFHNHNLMFSYWLRTRRWIRFSVACRGWRPSDENNVSLPYILKRRRQKRNVYNRRRGNEENVKI